MPNDTIHVSSSTCCTALDIIRRLRSIIKIRKTYDKEVCIPLDQAALQSECTDPGAPLSYNYKQPVHACYSSPAALCVLYSARAAALQSSQHCHLLASSRCKPITCCRHHYMLSLYWLQCSWSSKVYQRLSRCIMLCRDAGQEGQGLLTHL